ncbi:hypothetical protein ONE63_000574 [Megalurothrips usitatus]|uniref:Chitin-binding type-2 domain-containing protein n=1 Tax=Megalurothrips usitatus TaxID=439358 RepID=A0AAV7Y1Z1_9NEOP|nr:hypothetical protein ONE63_000574 [Megalurothrips usitatus]
MSDPGGQAGLPCCPELNGAQSAVFHVCALTEDGLIMKSFLCPESTLFDQTVLKCNWWFYVDCKASRRLYDSNIPVSKSYQLMKALAFFSSYKKQEEEERQPQLDEVPRGRALQQPRLAVNQSTPVSATTSASVPSSTRSRPTATRISTPPSSTTASLTTVTPS